MRTRTLALGLAGIVLAGGCSHQEAFDDARQEIKNQDVVIRELRAANEELQAANRELQARLKASQAEVAALKEGRSSLDRDVEAIEARIKEFEERFGKLDELGGIRMKAAADGVALEVAETVLFETGKADLRPEGKELLKEVAGRISSHEGHIRVEGHTDNRPVVLTRDQYPMGNLQLSGKRALVVADFLIDECGLDAERVSFAGYGEHRPVVPNTSPENMARNRRVEIVLVATADEDEDD